MRLIDADELHIRFKEISFGDLTGDELAMVMKFYDMINNTPTIDVEPVRHGHWIEVHEEDGYDYDCWMCPECGHISQHDFALIEEVQAIGDMLYCQHCGAKMDGDQDE